MPPRETPTRRRRRLAAARGVTPLVSDFAHICRKHPDRIGIVCEGDSWFAYPRKWIAFGADINVVHHIEDQVTGTGKVNLLRLACNGDEAVDMLSGKQKENLARVFQRNAAHINLVLFSGGGNDIVGKRDMPALLRRHQPGFSAVDCIHLPRFERKLDAIMLAYEELVDLRDEYIPHAKIITHTYDIAQPRDKGAEFFWGLIKTRPWIHPYLVEKNIPPELHLGVVQHLLSSFQKRMLALGRQPGYAARIKVVKTQGTLRIGHGADWMNEIHPTEAGFKRITRKIYAAMKQAQPGLPAWD